VKNKHIYIGAGVALIVAAIYLSWVYEAGVCPDTHAGIVATLDCTETDLK
jgi:hypothetical protein